MQMEFNTVRLSRAAPLLPRRAEPGRIPGPAGDRGGHHHRRLPGSDDDDRAPAASACPTCC
ncbi:MAG: hypothetical protein MZW92_11580 [Comamonadaceae bacterium]|nr:hypothetical protein [Comamonadaceae bacterium]